MRTHILVAGAIAGNPSVRALLIGGGRIREVLDERGLRDRRRSFPTIDIDGVIHPGFTDAHSHPAMGAATSRGVDLTAVEDLDGLRRILADERDRLPSGGWLLGWGLPHGLWNGADPTSTDIEDATGPLPAALTMFDAHSMLVNRAALAQAGIAQGEDLRHRFPRRRRQRGHAHGLLARGRSDGARATRHLGRTRLRAHGTSERHVEPHVGGGSHGRSRHGCRSRRRCDLRAVGGGGAPAPPPQGASVGHPGHAR